MTNFWEQCGNNPTHSGLLAAKHQTRKNGRSIGRYMGALKACLWTRGSVSR